MGRNGDDRGRRRRRRDPKERVIESWHGQDKGKGRQWLVDEF